MTFKKVHLSGSALGSKYIYQDVEYVAAAESDGCDHCAFNREDSSQSCDLAPRGCATHSIVWMTPADAITRRLTA